MVKLSLKCVLSIEGGRGGGGGGGGTPHMGNHM